MYISNQEKKIYNYERIAELDIKDYFRITFGSDFMYDKILNVTNLLKGSMYQI